MMSDVWLGCEVYIGLLVLVLVRRGVLVGWRIRLGIYGRIRVMGVEGILGAWLISSSWRL